MTLGNMRELGVRQIVSDFGSMRGAIESLFAEMRYGDPRRCGVRPARVYPRHTGETGPARADDNCSAEGRVPTKALCTLSHVLLVANKERSLYPIEIGIVFQVIVAFA